MFKEFKIGEKTYNCVMNALAIVEAEKKLGYNPINVLTDMAGEKLPTLEAILTILWASLLKYEHGIKLADVYDLYDLYIEDGHVFTDIIPEIVEIFKVSGFFKEEDGKNSKKRAK